ncbi:hypothetical protein DFH27DRAFT_302604 [Peziza echinospora]|nr:hypothetical protein DFH27DRAFT_302604 [Peziza echinospora]
MVIWMCEAVCSLVLLMDVGGWMKEGSRESCGGGEIRTRVGGWGEILQETKAQEVSMPTQRSACVRACVRELILKRACVMMRAESLVIALQFARIREFCVRVEREHVRVCVPRRRWPSLERVLVLERWAVGTSNMKFNVNFNENSFIVSCIPTR